MNTRIRYSKVSDGSFVSMRVIKSNDGKEYRANILPSGNEGFIEDLSKPGFVVGFKGTSSHKVKIALKKALKELGCVFEAEKRGEE